MQLLGVMVLMFPCGTYKLKIGFGKQKHLHGTAMVLCHVHLLQHQHSLGMTIKNWLLEQVIIRLYDINARRRPMIAFDFLESPIKAVEADTDGNIVYIGTGNGALASFDMRSGKMLGSYKGRISGSIRCITVHPSLPVFAACGLDRFLRVFHKNSRELLTQIFLKQPLIVNVFDTHYPAKALTADDSPEVSSVEYSDNALLYAENEMLDSVGSKKKTKKKTKESKKMKSTQDELLEVDDNIYAVSEKACKKRKAQRLEGRESHLKAHKKKKRSESST
ncbi:hypothetical protein KP509_12G000200 [Ceratopteris richardii]|uniref:Uncharacterized protein n=1 Tax=Ceratopteris richardii TaxID=49495 RepID=A0A8T2TKI9_CERRI|nr:hypothetical protein KP509_12G000200 [Ceratopteris richardii]